MSEIIYATEWKNLVSGSNTNETFMWYTHGSSTGFIINRIEAAA